MLIMTLKIQLNKLTVIQCSLLMSEKAKHAQVVQSHPTVKPYNAQTNSLRPESVISAKQSDFVTVASAP